MLRLYKHLMGNFARVLLLLLLSCLCFCFLKQGFSVDWAGLESADSPASALLMCVIFILRRWRDGVKRRAACLFSLTCSEYCLSILFVRVWNSYDRFYLVRSHRWVKTRATRILTGQLEFTNILESSMSVCLKLISEATWVNRWVCTMKLKGLLNPRKHFSLILYWYWN